MACPSLEVPERAAEFVLPLPNTLKVLLFRRIFQRDDFGADRSDVVEVLMFKAQDRLCRFTAGFIAELPGKFSLRGSRSAAPRMNIPRIPRAIAIRICIGHSLQTSGTSGATASYGALCLHSPSL